MEAVNLLPEYARAGRRWTSAGSELSSRRILPFGGAVAIAFALIFGLLYFHERSVVSDKKNELATAKARLVAQSARAEPIKQAQASSQARLAFMRSITATRVHWDSVLGDLGKVLPSGVSLNTLAASGSVVAAVAGSATGSSSFTISGATTSHDRVALVLDRLALLPWLTNVSLQSTSHTANTVAFTIGGSYVPGGGS